MSAKRQECFFVFDNLLGDSDWAQRIRRRVIQSSTHRFNTSVTGPTGTGKRLIARALHEHGSRRDFPFIPVDCGLLPGVLFRSQVFGQAHRETTTLGCLRSANRGTIYLANVDAIDLKAQSDLLQAIEERKVTPLGTRESFSFDARVIVGSVHNLERAVKAGRFLAGLYQRLCVLQFETTPLHTRPGDIAPIANHLVAQLTFERGLGLKQLSKAAIELLTAYQWPGNVTELARVLDEAVSRVTTGWIDVDDLPIDSSHVRPTWPSLADMEVKHIRETLALASGNTQIAATMLGIETDELEFRLAQIDAE